MVITTMLMLIKLIIFIIIFLIPSPFLHLYCQCMIHGALDYSGCVDCLALSLPPAYHSHFSHATLPAATCLLTIVPTLLSSWKAPFPPQPCRASKFLLLLKDFAETWSSLREKMSSLRSYPQI